MVAVIDCDEETVEITHDAQRDESTCGVFCDAEPEEIVSDTSVVDLFGGDLR